MSYRMDHIVDMIVEGDVEGANEFLLTESEENKIMKAMGGEIKLMNYLLKFEQFLDDHDIYMFKGWDEADIVGNPRVDKFWVTFHLRLQEGSEIEGAKRLQANQKGQNQIKGIQLDDGSYLLRIKILKKFLDDIEKQNKEKSDQLSDEEVEMI